MKKYLPLLLLFIITILLRVIFLPNPGFEADVAFWKGWGLASADKGVVWGILNTNNNYPTPFSYTLGAMTSFYRLLGGNPHDFNDYWTNTNVRFLIASKLPAVLADFGIAFIFLWIGSKFRQLFESTDKKPVFITLPRLGKVPILFVIIALIYLFNPVSIMDGAWWGQVDSIGVIVFLCAFVALLYKKPYLAGVLFMAAMMTKLQNMIYGPLFFAFVWHEFGFNGLIRAVAGAITGFFGLNIEFFLSKNMSPVLGSLVNNYDYFPWMSLHAYNIWWIVSGGHGMQMSDKLLTIGTMTANALGTIMFAATYLLAMLQLTPLRGVILSDRRESKNPHSIFHFFLGLSLINAGFFLFPTQSHERYAFPLTVFLLFLVPFLSQRKRLIFLLGYGVWSILYFINLHTALAANYPEYVLQFLMWVNAPTPTIIISVIFLSAFAGLLVFFAKQIKPLPFILVAIFFVSIIVFKNLGFVTKKPLLLSKMKPFASFQGYGQRATDMPVNAKTNEPKTWNWLSDQYAFFSHGIGTHAVSEIRYDIGRRFSELTTSYGIDTEAGNGASATFEIWGDNKQLFASEKMGRFDLPKYVRVDIKGVKTLVLITKDAGDGNRDDHTDWLNTKLYR